MISGLAKFILYLLCEMVIANRLLLACCSLIITFLYIKTIKNTNSSWLSWNPMQQIVHLVRVVIDALVFPNNQHPTTVPKYEFPLMTVL